MNDYYTSETENFFVICSSPSAQVKTYICVWIGGILKNDNDMISAILNYKI